MEYYERVATRELADDFYREFRLFVEEAAVRPESFAIRERDIRRANLRRFPYHFLFRNRWRFGAHSGGAASPATPGLWHHARMKRRAASSLPAVFHVHLPVAAAGFEV